MLLFSVFLERDTARDELVIRKVLPYDAADAFHAGIVVVQAPDELGAYSMVLNADEDVIRRAGAPHRKVLIK
jgi:hypothetical protein